MCRFHFENVASPHVRELEQPGVGARSGGLENKNRNAVCAALTDHGALPAVLAIRVGEIEQGVLNQSPALAVANGGVDGSFGPYGDVLAVGLVRHDEVLLRKRWWGRYMDLFGGDGVDRVRVLPGHADLGACKRFGETYGAYEDLAGAAKVLLPRPGVGGCARPFSKHGGHGEFWGCFGEPERGERKVKILRHY